MADGGWDDLFAAAAGDSQAPGDPSDASVISGRPADPSSAPRKRSRREDDLPDDIDTRRSSRRRNKKKSKKKQRAKKSHYRHGGSGSSGKQKELLSHVLAGRMDISPQSTRIWPIWLQPGGSLIHNGGSNANTTTCNQYHGAYNAETLGGKNKKKEFKCTNCGKSPLEHKLELHLESEANDNVSCNRHMDVFVMNRNIRACAANALALQRKSNDVGGSGKRDKAGPAAAGRYARVAKQIASAALSDVHPVVSMVYSGEASILQDKFESLSQSVDRWYRDRHNDASADRGFEEMVRVIIASDALYYRLYYLQVIGELPILELNDDTSSTGSSGRLAYIPHPTTYFLVDYLCWDSVAGERYVNKYLKEQVEQGPDGAVKSTLEYYVNEDQGSQSTKYRHPLLLLRNNRFVETYLYFSGSGWVDNYSTTKRDFIRAAKASSKHASASASRLEGGNTFYAKHESPAPALLMEWRDSCRDFLCNLYAYATISPESIAFIKSNLVCRVSGIIEPGAGTGYIASLLQIAGIDVDPYDIAPPKTKHGDAMNEYHGRTPSFTSVGNGDVDELKRKLRSSFAKIGSVPALLLCYPPPKSSMAHDALANYIAVGGETVVHIGEWQGLTGSSNFEKLLVRRFHCGYRQRCLTWGTDASEVTIWEASGANSLPDAEHVLIPCSNCKQRPAVRRCRFVRLLGYCSGQCYDEHAHVRATHYLCNMVPHVLSQKSSFDDDVYTSSLLDDT